jgi:hypothetical protein
VDEERTDGVAVPPVFSAGGSRSNSQSDQAWWYRISTGAVEYGVKTKALDRIGPFASEEEAARALEIVRARARSWRDSDGRED